MTAGTPFIDHAFSHTRFFIMHQSHNIPWHLLSANFEIIHNVTPYLSLKGNNLGQLKHFIRKFTQSIITFSETERTKHPLTFEYPTTGNLFSDQLRDSYPDYLDKQNQRIEYWLATAQRHPVTGQRSYNTRHGRLADVVKILLHENQLPTLLMLANHPNIPVAHLHSLSWGHHFGFSRVKESAVRAYMFFNSAYATGILENGVYRDLLEYKHLLREVAINMDFPAQQIPHIQFLTKCGVHIADVYKDNPKEISVHGDMQAIQDYLKSLFALMYRYDLFMRECGLDPNWEAELGLCAPLNQVKRTWIEKEGRWDF